MIFVKKVIRKLILLGQIARLFEKIGIWVLPIHFYTPIPELELIRKDHNWDSRIHDLPGIDLNVKDQLKLLEFEFPKYVGEYNYPLTKPQNSNPDSFYFNNGMFANTDAEVYYCMIRHFKPRRIIEVGAGRSTQICCAAVNKNSEKDGIKAEINVIEPYPNKKILNPLDKKLERLIESRVQDIGFDFFQQLNKNDILFIDSSHVVKSGGDVNYLFLEIIPRLNPEVIVQIHDIRLPYEVPKLFIIDQARFFTEQYLLQAFLIGNKDFEILWGTCFMTKKFPEKIASIFRSSGGGTYAGGSFWIQRKATQVNAEHNIHS